MVLQAVSYLWCCKLEQVNDAAAVFSWDKQRIKAGALCDGSSLQHPIHIA